MSGSLTAAIADSLAVNPGLGQTLLDLSPGEIVGEVWLLRSPLSAIMAHAQADSVVLELPYAPLQTRLKQDPPFASRFYRAIAILLLRRFEQMLEKFSRRRGLQVSLMQDAPAILGQLHDSDIAWMVEHGTVQEAAPDEALIQVGRGVETLYIVLYGELSVAMADESKRSDLNEIFSQLRGVSNSAGRQIARIGRGEIAGETALLDSRLSDVLVKAREPSVLLALRDRSWR